MRSLRVSLALATVVMAGCGDEKTVETWTDVGKPVSAVVEGGIPKTDGRCQEIRGTTNRDDKERRAVLIRMELPSGISPPVIDGLTKAKLNLTVKLRTTSGTFTGVASVGPYGGQFPVWRDPPLPSPGGDPMLFITPGLKECSLIVRP